MSRHDDDLADARGRDAGEQIFVDGVLRELLGSNEARLSTLVDQSMRAIDRQQPRTWRARWSGVAALLLIGIVLLFALDQRDPLLADVEQIIAVADRSVDRRYDITLNGEHVGQLYRRGRRKYAVARRRPAGTLWYGFDGKQDWIVPASERLPVLIGPGVEDAPAWRRHQLRLPRFVRLLRRMAFGYELSIERTSATIEIRGSRSEHTPLRFPERLQIVADRLSKVVRRVDMEWGPLRHVVLDLADPLRQPDDWYEPGAHHAPGRPTRRMRRRN